MKNGVNSLQAVLLCGGKGERLRPLTESLPKPLIPIKGRPILSYLINHLTRFGVTDLVVAAGYQAHRIEEYFQQNHRELTVKVVDSGIDTDIIERLRACQPHLKNDFLVCYGDTLADVNLEKLFQFHQKHPGDVTITGYPLKSQFGLMEFDSSGQVSEFQEKPTLSKWINIGYYLFDRAGATRLTKYPRFVDFLSDQVKEGHFFGFKHEGIHITVNTLQELSDAEQNIHGFEDTL